MPEAATPAAPEPEPEIAAAAEPQPVAANAAKAPEEIVAEPAPAPVVSVEDVEIIAEPAPVRRPPPKAPAPPKRTGAFVAWTALAATVAAVVGGVIFREQVVGVWPASASVFAAVGLPADPLGLVIDDVRSQATLQGGRPVLSVTGAIRNTRSETVTAPPLHISLLDRDGKPVAAKVARPLNAQIPPGAKRYFAIAIPDPPAGSASLDIVFEALKAAGATHTAEAPVEPPVEAVLGPEPMEARPVPEAHGSSADHG